MEEIFVKLTYALQNTAAIALLASFVWGVLSILLSPCHLTSIPLIIGYINGGKEKLTLKRAFIQSLVFSIGILITILVIGLITALMGRMVGDIGRTGYILIAIVLFIVGLYLMEIISLDWNFTHKINKIADGLIGAFVLGLIFGAAVGPCTFAYMAPILGVVFSVAKTRVIYSIMLILFYSIGHCSVIVIAGTSAELVEKYLNWNEQNKSVMIMKKICGLLVIVGSVYLVLKQF